MYTAAEEFIAVTLDPIKFIPADDGLDFGNSFIVTNPRFIEFNPQYVVNLGLHLPGLFPCQVDQRLGILLRNSLLKEDFL